MKPKTEKNKRFWSLSPIILLLTLALAAAVMVSFFYNRILFYVELVLFAAVLIVIGWRLRRMKKDIGRYLRRIAGSLNQSEQDALSAVPLPVMVSAVNGEIIWYNDLFRHQVLDGNELFGESVGVPTGGATMGELQKKKFIDVSYAGRRYTVYISPVRVREATLYVLYYVDDTQLKEIAEEYALSRPAVMMVYIDNIEELMQNIRDSERAQLSGRVETLLEDWISITSGILRKFGTDHFMVVVEQRHLQKIIEGRFDILDRVRTIQTGDHMSVTLSIGVGQGDTLRDSEAMAKQAIEMALGRGGDQAAVKTKNGFDFYGGVSKGVEKRTKVRTRVVASALQELITGSDNVLVMGHRFSDLDCLGSAVALAAAARNHGRPAYVVTQRSKTLARELIERYEEAGRGGYFYRAG